jgi:hypothetical protein
MSYKGKYKPKHPEKYKGNPVSIIYRSLWERKFMVHCDNSESVLEWSSEEVFLNYYDPTTNRIRRYFPDFLIKVRESNGTIKKYMIEIKPKKQTTPPPKPKRQTKRYLQEAYEYAKNQSKWAAAREWCADRGYEFKVFTENELFGSK